ncbi:MAG: kinase [Proteobacteria bacterium]|nr:kinase [Pseudomonadota bacterium]MBI3498794.1 kinase [Pseudomonadota bacterium]
MIISRTPFRVSLFGGGTDYPRWYREHGGAVLGTAINKYCYITVRPLPPFFEHKHRIVYARIELVKAIDDIVHPSVRAVLQEHPFESGIEIHHDGDLPARSGLGSSSSFTAGLLNALFALQGKMITKRKLAEETIRIEQEIIGESVGSQDQIWAAYGGLARINFGTDGRFEVRPIVIPDVKRQELEQGLLLFFTGVSRYSTDIAREKIANLDKRATQLRTMTQMVDEAEAILTNPMRKMTELGRLLHEGWRLKRELADSVSNAHIDEIYEAAMAAGATGGKLLGAGGGGFMAFLVEPGKRAAVTDRLSRLIHVPVGIGAAGSRIIVYEPDGQVDD